MAAVNFRIATAAAFAAGFVLGSVRSKRTRLRVVAEDGSTARPRSRPTRIGLTPAKLRAIAVLTAVRARDAVGVGLGWRDGEEATDALVVEMAGDLATAINGRTSLAV
jgi:hypothetical protein